MTINSVSGLGKNVQHYRLKRSLSRQVLGEKVHYSRVQIFLIEKDRRRIPYDSIKLFADAFDISVYELFNVKIEEKQ